MTRSRRPERPVPGEGVEIPIYRRNRTSARLDGSEWDYEVRISGSPALYVFSDRSRGRPAEWWTDTGLAANSLSELKEMISQELNRSG